MLPSTFCVGVIAFFGRFESEGALRATLRNLRQAGAVSVAAYTAHTTDYCSRAYANFAIENKLSLAVNYFTANIAVSSQNYVQQKHARQTLGWQETLTIAQTNKNARLSYQTSAAAIISNENDSVSKPEVHECTNTGNTAARLSDRKNQSKQNGSVLRSK